MAFKEELIKELKQYPDLYNEVRAEIIVDNENQISLEEANKFIHPQEDSLLQQISDKALIAAIIDNLKYYIEYEKEIGESDL